MSRRTASQVTHLSPSRSPAAAAPHRAWPSLGTPSGVHPGRTVPHPLCQIANAVEFRRLIPLLVAARHRDDYDDAPQTERTQKLARLESVLFVANAPLTARKLAQFAALSGPAEVHRLVAKLNEAYDADDTAFRVELAGGGYRLRTRPQYAFWLDQIHHRSAAVKLSPPAMETLTIVAYRQPITRADVESIRGVQSAEMLKQLMERGLVTIVGEDDSLGRPYLYGTTRRFLELFGLQSLEDLPDYHRLRRPAGGERRAG
ncbi:MAG: SMC-Scp complex subunit ScpB [Planctomycetota bacterium]|nr:MAG: SMC-Scp complex subunit ScpB [Planctomycetota bacterium]